MKKNYFEKRKERLAQKIKLLVSRPDFQKEILELRRKWNIPLNGIKNEEDNQNWNSQLLIDTDEYYTKNWPRERKEIIKLREQGKFREAEKIKQEINLQAPLNALSNDIWNIIVKYRLSPRWHSGIRRYLLFNDPKNMGIEIGLTVSISWEHGIKQISLEVDRDTTLEDLKKVWSWARKMYKDKQSKKFQPIKNFERDQEAYNLKKSGKSYNEIADILSVKYKQEKTISYEDVGSYIKRHKKRTGIN